MTRGLRRIHRFVWLILAAALAVGYGLALGVRPEPAASSTSSDETSAQR